MADPAEVIPGAEPVAPGAPAPVSRAAREPRGVRCDMCGCVLDDTGKVLKRGEEAAAYLDLADQLKAEKAAAAKLRERVTELETENADARGKLAEATKKKSWLL